MQVWVGMGSREEVWSTPFLFSLSVFVYLYEPVILNSYFYLLLGLAFDAYFNSYFVYFILMSFCSYSFFFRKNGHLYLKPLKTQLVQVLFFL